MQTQIWSKLEEKSADILTLNGPAIHRIKVSGNMLTLKRNYNAVLAALEGGKAPADAGGKLIESLDARTITKAELGEGNGSLTIHGGRDAPTSIRFSPKGNDADRILAAILEQAGRSFTPQQEPITAVEALIPPAVVGLIGGGLSFAAYGVASEMAAGKDVEVKGFRKRGIKQMLVNVSEMLGPTGSLALGTIILLLVAFWAFRRLTHRPMRTVLLPATA